MIDALLHILSCFFLMFDAQCPTPRGARIVKSQSAGHASCVQNYLGEKKSVSDSLTIE